MGTDSPGSSTSHRFEAPRLAIESAIHRLKAHGNVAPDATFNPDAPDGLRREIAYHDEDFLRYLGNSDPDIEREVVEAAVSFLAEHGVWHQALVADENRFRAFRRSIRENFSGGWTSFTPVMERLFYTLTALRRPSRLVEFGSYWGNTLAWFAGPALGTDRLYKAQSVLGVDTDSAAVEAATRNFRKISAEDDVTLMSADALEVASEIRGPIDYLYLEAKEEGAPPIYLELLQAVYDKLPDGAWVIAHDIYDKDSIQELQPYVNWVRDPAHFKASVAFDVDYCGAELSVK